MIIMMIHIYEDVKKMEWDEFNSEAKNGHFFFYRDYIEYHNDRFHDFSLIIYNDKGNIMALLPASINEGLYIANDVWREMYDFSDDAVLMVLASEWYSEKDYIRDYSEFCKYICANQ